MNFGARKKSDMKAQVVKKERRKHKYWKSHSHVSVMSSLLLHYSCPCLSMTKRLLFFFFAVE